MSRGRSDRSLVSTVYETCSSLGITLFTIAHQKTVIKHHKVILRFDGKGGWAIEDVTPESAMH